MSYFYLTERRPTSTRHAAIQAREKNAFTENEDSLDEHFSDTGSDKSYEVDMKGK